MSDYDAAISAAAVFDRSDTAKLVLSGPDAPMFLGNLCTNDIKSLSTFGCEAYFCNPQAKVQFQTWIYRIRKAEGHSELWVETTPGRNTDLANYLDRYLISERVTIADRTAEFAQLHLAGPDALTMLKKAVRGRVENVVEFGHLELQFGTRAVCQVRRHDPLGLRGYDIVCRTEWVEDVRSLLRDAGATPAGPETYETLRIEAGTPVFGPDIDENRFVMEVGNAERAVSYTKGCFLGQEPIVMARDRAGHVNRAFLGLKVLEGGPLPPGTKLFRDGQDVSVVTSSCHSPRLGMPVALAYIRWKHQEPGTRMEGETSAGRQPVVVLGFPPVK